MSVRVLKARSYLLCLAATTASLSLLWALAWLFGYRAPRRPLLDTHPIDLIRFALAGSTSGLVIGVAVIGLLQPHRARRAFNVAVVVYITSVAIFALLHVVWLWYLAFRQQDRASSLLLRSVKIGPAELAPALVMLSVWWGARGFQWTGDTGEDSHDDELRTIIRVTRSSLAATGVCCAVCYAAYLLPFHVGYYVEAIRVALTEDAGLWERLYAASAWIHYAVWRLVTLLVVVWPVFFMTSRLYRYVPGLLIVVTMVLLLRAISTVLFILHPDNHPAVMFEHWRMAPLLLCMLYFNWPLVLAYRKDFRDFQCPMCPRCGYSLRGLLSEICPECGREVRCQLDQAGNTEQLVNGHPGARRNPAEG